MANDKDTEQIDDLENGSIANADQELSGANQLPTSNLNNETENMEVHHHPDLHHKPKPWKEYFFEFLMIFLAVTLGFFAENIREHFTEVRKGKEYAISYKEDLAKDTVIIQGIITILKRDIDGCDSLIFYLENDRMKVVADLQKIYQYNLTSLGGFSLDLTDRTASQLKNSGGMLLLSKKNVADGILDYWQNAAVLESIESAATILRQQTREKTYLVFDNKYYSTSSDSFGRRVVSADARLITDNFLQLAELRNRLTHFKNTVKGAFISGLAGQKKQAIQLIKLIEKEYE